MLCKWAKNQFKRKVNTNKEKVKLKKTRRRKQETKIADKLNHDTTLSSD